VTNNWLQTPAKVAILWGNKDLLSVLDTTLSNESDLNDFIVQNEHASFLARQLNQNDLCALSTREETRVLKLNPDAVEFRPSHEETRVPCIN
jgi:hypothetical protein